MNIYEPIKDSDSYWYVKKKVGKLTFPVGWCVAKDHKHTTPEEASDCYKHYLIEERGSCLPGGIHVDNFKFGEKFKFKSNF